MVSWGIVTLECILGQDPSPYTPQDRAKAVEEYSQNEQLLIKDTIDKKISAYQLRKPRKTSKDNHFQFSITILIE